MEQDFKTPVDENNRISPVKTSTTKTTITTATTATISSTSLLVKATLPTGVDVEKACENFLKSDETEANFSRTRIDKPTYTKTLTTTITTQSKVVTTTVVSMSDSLVENKSMNNSSAESKVVETSHETEKHIKEKKSIKQYGGFLGVFDNSITKLVRLQKLLKQRLGLSNSDTATLLRDYCIYLHLGFAGGVTDEEVIRGRKAIKSINQATAMRVLLTNEKDTESAEIAALINTIHKEAFPSKNPNRLVETLTNKYSTRSGSRKKRKSIRTS